MQKECLYCGERYIKPQLRSIKSFEKSNFCSRKCVFDYRESQFQSLKCCLQCNKEIERRVFPNGTKEYPNAYKRRKFCSRKCSAIYFSGDNGRKWTGGRKCSHCGKKPSEGRFTTRYMCCACHYKIYATQRRAANIGRIDLQAWFRKCEKLGNKCQLCGKTNEESKLTIDHIIPVSKGGKNNINNLQPLCHSCNVHKSNKMPLDYLAHLAIIKK